MIYSSLNSTTSTTLKMLKEVTEAEKFRFMCEEHSASWYNARDALAQEFLDRYMLAYSTADCRGPILFIFHPTPNPTQPSTQPTHPPIHSSTYLYHLSTHPPTHPVI